MRRKKLPATVVIETGLCGFVQPTVAVFDATVAPTTLACTVSSPAAAPL